MRVLCIQEAAERNDISYDEMVRVVTVHEIGHLMGIWDHVPRSCDEDEAEMPFKVTDEGYQICGHAFMNPVISAQFHVRDTVTELDLEAFDYRRAHVSILPAETVVRSAKDIEMRFDSE